ncbi:unnamed protein product [Rhizophagus irregularis]|uniref:Uncharacterized protein n=1 Tax=Rhizophagus irregularis TaxID=588596 RepID=A0A915Z168_9GLOM|nr:unnamed protein product [Rhizophagus irregularis]CAB5356884.1 unnamed protein product [Rhizophagus irregularis]
MFLTFHFFIFVNDQFFKMISSLEYLDIWKNDQSSGLFCSNFGSHNLPDATFQQLGMQSLVFGLVHRILSMLKILITRYYFAVLWLFLWVSLEMQITMQNFELAPLDANFLVGLNT